jgi:hypothetical protein
MARETEITHAFVSFHTIPLCGWGFPGPEPQPFRFVGAVRSKAIKGLSPQGPTAVRNSVRKVFSFAKYQIPRTETKKCAQPSARVEDTLVQPRDVTW